MATSADPPTGITLVGVAAAYKAGLGGREAAGSRPPSPPRPHLPPTPSLWACGRYSSDGQTGHSPCSEVGGRPGSPGQESASFAPLGHRPRHSLRTSHGNPPGSPSSTLPSSSPSPSGSRGHGSAGRQPLCCWPPSRKPQTPRPSIASASSVYGRG